MFNMVKAILANWEPKIKKAENLTGKKCYLLEGVRRALMMIMKTYLPVGWRIWETVNPHPSKYPRLQSTKTSEDTKT